MSTTEKLAHGNHRAEKLLRAGVPFFVVKASEPYARQVVALIKANEGTNWTAECEAWAESVLPAPAGEVTADAVQLALDSWYGLDGGLHGGNDSEERQRMQAALAAAFPVLVQQVERLTAERDFHIADAQRLARNVTVAMNDRDKFIAERDTLSADNARLQNELLSLRTSIEPCMHCDRGYEDHDCTCMESTHRWKEFIAKTYAATAQAKQAEGGK